MGKGDVYKASSQALCVHGGLPGEAQGGSAGGEVQDLDIVPGDAPSKSGADGFHECFFGGEACGEAFKTVGFGEGVSDFVGGEDAVEEAIAETGVGVADTGDFGEVGADRKDHAFIVP